MKIVMLERKVLGMDMDMSRFRDVAEVVEYDVSTNENAAVRIGNADVVIVNKVRMNADTLDGCPNVRLILEAATGTDNIDMDYCKGRGITVMNAKGYSTPTVAQHTFAMYFYLSEHLPYYDEYVKDGRYSRQPLFSHFENYFSDLSGSTWGIVGMGAIGRLVASIANAFGAKVLAYSASGGKYDSDGSFEQTDFDTLLEKSDVISIHTPMNEHTKNLFDYEALKKMKRNAYLINVARGPIVNDADLAVALDDNLIAGAALDVMGKEPIEADNPLLSVRNKDRLLITPHMAWGSVEARTRLIDIIYSNLLDYIKGEKEQ